MYTYGVQLHTIGKTAPTKYINTNTLTRYFYNYEVHLHLSPLLTFFVGGSPLLHSDV
jgi:hypothetical protein